jgi:glycosyltransferase involved in cell wall biosynthesis
LRILHLANDLYPRVTGGTEIFVQQLIEAQWGLPQPEQVLWAAHAAAATSADHNTGAALAPHQRLLPPVQPAGRLASVGHAAAAIPGFEALLQEWQPDLLHLHSLSPRCGLSHVRAARRAGVPVVVTVHAPGFTCLQGSLLHHRTTPCDGRIRPWRCSECRLVNAGLPAPLAGLIALQNGWPLSPERPGRLAHLLTSRRVTSAFGHAWRELLQGVAGFHVLAAWSAEVLRRNGVSERQLRLIRTAGPAPLPPRQRRPLADGVLRLVYWGRCAEVKGLHLVIDAIRSLPAELPVQLSFYGPYWDDSAYGRSLQGRIAGDPRFIRHGPIVKEALLPLLQEHDLAVVPSTWYETGPLTVLEAFAAGLPVAGSDLGGIRELLQGQACGFLLPLRSEAWAGLIRQLLADPSPLAATTPVPRPFSTVAASLQAWYGELTAETAA